MSSFVSSTVVSELFATFTRSVAYTPSGPADMIVISQLVSRNVGAGDGIEPVPLPNTANAAADWWAAS